MTTIRGITTKYRNTNFRSRTEARWAAFFDHLGWDWEYEPFDAAGYIPDFVLTGPDPVLIEVKPDTTVAELGAYLPRILTAIEGIWAHDLLVVGSTPLPHGDTTWTGGHPPIGALAEWLNNTHEHDDGAGLWLTCTKCGRTTFMHSHLSYRSRVCGHHDGDHYLGSVDLHLLDTAWAAARNHTQWKRD